MQIRELLEKVLDDDDDMRDMNLAARWALGIGLEPRYTRNCSDHLADCCCQPLVGSTKSAEAAEHQQHTSPRRVALHRQGAAGGAAEHVAAVVGAGRRRRGGARAL